MTTHDTGQESTPLGVSAFMAALGYPDHENVTTERTIWHGTNGQTRSKVCSTSSTPGTKAMMSTEIHEIVCRVYTTSLSLPHEWSPQQRAEFLENEASRMSDRVDDLSDQLAAHVINEWKRTHDGEHPDYMTNVGLINNSRLQAMEIVLTEELYELIPPEQDEPSTLSQETQPTPDRSQTPWDQRWTIPELRTDPSETIEDLIARIWPEPTYSAYFRIKAGYLLAAREEDAMTLPRDPAEPLAVQLAQMVHSDLRRDGYPVR